MNQPKPEPYQPSWTSDYFREAVAPHVSPLGRGLVGHVPLIAIGLIVQGALELLFGALMLLMGIFFFVVRDPELAGMRPLGGLMAALAVPGFACGVLRLVAGVYNLRYKRRKLGMWALGLGLFTMITGYCALTSIGLAIYGLIVYLNDSVIEAFGMGDAGKKAADIQAAFPPAR
jgi:hypothetical protein